MDKKSFALLVIIMVVMWWVGNGLTPLLPVYALQLGATPAVAGYYLAFAWLMVSAGGLAGGWISDRTGRRKVWMLLANLVSPACLVGMGQTRSFWPFAAFTGILWFAGGLALALSLVMVGLRSARAERGKLFGILGMANPLGSLLGGATFGPAADQWGYPAMLGHAGALYILPVALLFLLPDPETPPLRPAQHGASAARALGAGFYLLLWASFVSSVGGFVVQMTRSLAMHGAGFSASAIASTGMAAGLVALPLSPLAGWLSDRLGRKRLAVITFCAAFVGRCALVPASQLWHFWVAMALISVSSVSGSVLSAWVSDLAPREALGRALSLMNVSGWVGGVLGFGLAGLAIEGLGIAWTFGVAALSMLVAIGLLSAVRLRAAPGSPPNST